MKYKIILLVIILIGIAIYSFWPQKQVSALINYPTINWIRPSTDAQWNEDVKKEQVDFKNDEILAQMVKSHSIKVGRLQPEIDKWIQCPDCKRWEIKEQLKDSGMTDQEIEIEYQSQRKRVFEDWERINRAVERINKEIELRDKGFVIIAGEEKFGGSIPENRIRHIRP